MSRKSSELKAARRQQQSTSEAVASIAKSADSGKAAAVAEPRLKEPLISIGDEGQVRIVTANCRETIGSDDERFILGLINQIIHASTSGQVIDKLKSDFAISVLEAIKPRDEVEAMLAAQMAAVHMATMTMGRRLNQAETLAQQESAGSLMNKLARTSAAQTDAFKKYRSGGEQRITVQHVTVNEGGQAVVGNVNTGSKADREGGDGEN